MNRTEWQYITTWAKKIKSIQYLGGQCEKCGNNNIFQLEFHHRDKEVKDRNISKILFTNWTKIQKELDKCVLLCANCHNEYHENDNQSLDERRKSKEIYY